METSQEKLGEGQSEARLMQRKGGEQEGTPPAPPRGPKTPASLEHGLCGGEMGQPGWSGRDLTPRAVGSHERQEQRQIHCPLLIPHLGSCDHFWPMGGQTYPFQAEASKTQGTDLQDSSCHRDAGPTGR